MKQGKNPGVTREGKAGRRVAIGACVVFLVVFLVLPLIYILAVAFSDGWYGYRKAVTDEFAIKATLLTLKATVIALAINTVMGLCAA